MRHEQGRRGPTHRVHRRVLLAADLSELEVRDPDATACTLSVAYGIGETGLPSGAFSAFTWSL